MKYKGLHPNSINEVSQSVVGIYAGGEQIALFSTGSTTFNTSLTASFFNGVLVGSGSGSFSGSFQGDGSQLTGVVSTVSEIATVTANFTSTTSTVVTHNFDTKNVIISVYDNSDNQIIPESVTLTDNNNVTVTFSSPLSGFVVVAKGGHIVSGSATNILSAIISSSADRILTDNGDGTLTAESNLTFDGQELTITGSVGITGSLDVDLRTTTKILSASYIDLDVLANGDIPAHKAGRIFFGAEDGALSVYNEEADITLQVGQEFYVRAYNGTATTIPNGTPVRVSGSQGDRVRIFPALAEDHTSGPVFESHILGVATHAIESGSEGYVTAQGVVRGVDTSGFSAGDILYLQTGSAGFRNTPPPFPYDVVQVGYVARSASPNGFIFVEPKEPVHFSNISGLSGSYLADVGDLWVYQSNSSWTHTKTLSGSYTIDNGSLTANSFTGSLLGTASTASYVSFSGVDGLTSFSSSVSTRITDNEAGIASLTAQTSSYLLNTTDTLDGDLTVTGKITAQEFHTEFVSASIVYQSGSTQFGNSSDDTHIFSGSVIVSGSSHNIKGGLMLGELNATAQGDLHVFGGEIYLGNTEFNSGIKLTGGTSGFQITNQNEFGFADLVKVDMSGNVGIGTTSPGAKLDVRGSAIFNEDGNDVDFRVEGDTDQNLLFVDASADRVGIGTSSPATNAKLHVNGRLKASQIDLTAESIPIPNNTWTNFSNVSAALTAFGSQGSAFLVTAAKERQSDSDSLMAAMLVTKDGSQNAASISLGNNTGVEIRLNGNDIEAKRDTPYDGGGNRRVIVSIVRLNGLHEFKTP